ncbi:MULTISPECIES: endonuclease/exonuclease/phosphatase family protein [unclassified Microbacterium]|uniref:endonuclease/exonuclease/phosphatase family protein n=1 Tax=unclassified Microbacterium TaxID=2609290 RepID=UPI00214B0AE4|nr:MULTISPECIES: endonuclease/exonuclease/phosphatase family protein [unclassified Microbacterium]MCR2783764.1 endonuclease/exonuclease/phosphatase family protein [Microbacterium sp. zg.B96]WIM15384.1 endonuclease/exonuclease/phosphatase family protein [Microbacterium sp. zg-B96]
MRVVTWNVLWRFAPDWRARERALLTVLDRLQPDIVGLQEVWREPGGRSQADMVAQRFGMHAAFAGPSLPPVPHAPEHPEQAGVTLGVGLVSRWPLTLTAEHVLPATHRQIAPVALEARVKHPDAPFDVIVAATEWEPTFADDHLTQTTRLAELLRADTGVPRILLGDLNCDVTQAEYAPLQVGVDNAWDLGSGDPATVTLSSAVPFAPVEAGKEIDRRIDHILLAQGHDVRVDAAFAVPDAVDGIYPSDHFPVVADVTFADE